LQDLCGQAAPSSQNGANCSGDPLLNGICEERTAMRKTQIGHTCRPNEIGKTSYDRMSRWYDLFAFFESAYRKKGLEILNARQDECVLEIGFGTGHSIITMARSISAGGRIYGIDLSGGMCRIAQTRVNDADLTTKVTLLRGDARKLPFDNDSFDAISMCFTLELFDTPDIAIVLDECRRVLHRAGRIGLVAMSKQGEFGLAIRLYEWVHRAFPKFVDCRPILVRKEVEAAEFQIIDECRVTHWGVPVECAIARKQ
jgi:ubiquinone/menaquinone biosynthesis C-methylase UbiE